MFVAHEPAYGRGYLVATLRIGRLGPVWHRHGIPLWKEINFLLEAADHRTQQAIVALFIVDDHSNQQLGDRVVHAVRQLAARGDIRRRRSGVSLQSADKTLREWRRLPARERVDPGIECRHRFGVGHGGTSIHSFLLCVAGAVAVGATTPGWVVLHPTRWGGKSAASASRRARASRSGAVQSAASARAFHCPWPSSPAAGCPVRRPILFRVVPDRAVPAHRSFLRRSRRAPAPADLRPWL